MRLSRNNARKGESAKKKEKGMNTAGIRCKCIKSIVIDDRETASRFVKLDWITVHSPDHNLLQ